MNTMQQLMNNRNESLQVSKEVVLKCLNSLQSIGYVKLTFNSVGYADVFSVELEDKETREVYTLQNIEIFDVYNYVNYATDTIEGLDEDNPLCYAILETARPTYDSIVYGQ